MWTMTAASVSRLRSPSSHEAVTSSSKSKLPTMSMYPLIRAAKSCSVCFDWFIASTSTYSGGRQADHVARKSTQRPARDGIGMVRQILAIVFLDHLNARVVIVGHDLHAHTIKQLPCNARMPQRVHGHWKARSLDARIIFEIGHHLLEPNGVVPILRGPRLVLVFSAEK